MPALVAVAVIAGVAGCAPVSQQAAAAKQEQAVHSAIDTQRVCDANATSKHPSLWRSIMCHGGGSLPPECEKPGTDDLPVCHAFGLERLAAEQAYGRTAAEWATIGAISY